MVSQYLMRSLLGVGLSASLLFTTLPSLAADPPVEPSPPLAVNLAVDIPVTLGAAALWGASELLKPSLAPSTCRWCSVGAVDQGARDALVWSRPKNAAVASDVFAFGVMPAYAISVAALGAVGARHPEQAWTDLLVVAQASAIAMDINQAVKFIAGRQRPFVRAAGSSREPDPDDNLSFFSGHSTFAASIVGASTAVAVLHQRDTWPAVLATGSVLAVTTGYLRMGADKHYLSDVATGLTVGAVVGAVMPLVFHAPSSTKTPTIVATVGTSTFSVAGVF